MKTLINKDYVKEPLVHKEIQKVVDLFNLAASSIDPGHYYVQPVEVYDYETIEIDNGNSWE